MNSQFDKLINRHLNGQIGEDEKELLATILKDPENQLYLAAQIDEKFFAENLEAVADDETGKQVFNRILQHIQLETPAPISWNKQEPEVFLISWYRKKAVHWMAAAAAAIILIVSIKELWNYNQPGQQVNVAQNDTKGSEIVLPVIHREFNTTGKDKSIQLPDNSLVVLASNSEISYEEPFTNKRDITLKGKAFFKVTKDKSRPFTVLSGSITTTVLGTQFTVTAFEKANQLTVRLFEGKVAIRRLKLLNKKSNILVYLMPGEEFTYNKNGTYRVVKFNAHETKPDNTVAKETLSDNLSIPQNVVGDWYMFNNQSLPQVLDQLAILYNIKIVYNKKDVQNIYFTRKYKQSESLENILKEIATLHQLAITKKDSSFHISK